MVVEDVRNYKTKNPNRKDPWARFEAWRNHPQLSRRHNMMRMFPGFTWGVGAFLVAVAVEKFFFEKSDDAHGHGH